MMDFKIGQKIGRWVVSRTNEKITEFVEYGTHSYANTHDGVNFAYRKQVGIGQFHCVTGVVNSREEFEKL